MVYGYETFFDFDPVFLTHLPGSGGFIVESNAIHCLSINFRFDDFNININDYTQLSTKVTMGNKITIYNVYTNDTKIIY